MLIRLSKAERAAAPAGSRCSPRLTVGWASWQRLVHADLAGSRARLASTDGYLLLAAPISKLVGISETAIMTSKTIATGGAGEAQLEIPAALVDVPL